MAHAALTWPPRAAVALFAGGAAVAFVAEAVVIRLGWLEHHVGPRVLGVPLYALFRWTGLIYVAFRVALPWLMAGRQSSPGPCWRPATTHSTTTGASRRAW